MKHSCQDWLKFLFGFCWRAALQPDGRPGCPATLFYVSKKTRSFLLRKYVCSKSLDPPAVRAQMNNDVRWLLLHTTSVSRCEVSHLYETSRVPSLRRGTDRPHLLEHWLRWSSGMQTCWFILDWTTHKAISYISYVVALHYKGSSKKSGSLLTLYVLIKLRFLILTSQVTS